MKHPRMLAASAIALTTFGINPLFASGWWSAPPPALDHFADRLPAKSLGLLNQELRPEAGEVCTEELVQKRLSAIIGKVADAQRSETQTSLAALQKTMRVTETVGAKWFSLVNDLADCVAEKDITDREVQDYLPWRLALGTDYHVLKGNDYPEEQELKKHAVALQKKIDSAFPQAGNGLKGQLEYLRVAADYHTLGRRHPQVLAGFEAFLKTRPDHPRADDATISLARALISAARTEWGDEIEDDTKLARAETLLESFLKGRGNEAPMAGDAMGWLGAIAFHRNDLTKALTWYLKQASVPGHDEQRRSTQFMIEKVMGRILESPTEAELDQLAANPPTAMAAAYWLTHSPEVDQHNGYYDPPAATAKWRRILLPKLADRVAANKSAWSQKEYEPYFISLLGHAASSAGQHDKALQLIKQAKDSHLRSDDLLLLEGVALQRAGKPDAAAEAYRDLLKSYPKSSLSNGVTVKLATALQDAKKAGEAFLLLHNLYAKLYRPEPAAAKAEVEEEFGNSGFYFGGDIYPETIEGLPTSSSILTPNAELADPTYLKMQMDTILDFAPLSQLILLAEHKKEFHDKAEWDRLRRRLLSRGLHEGMIDVATSLAVSPEERALTTAAQASKQDPKSPANWQKLGDSLASLRMKLSYADYRDRTSEIYERPDSVEAEKVRLLNAATCGYAGQAEEKLLANDELWQAILAWQKVIETAPVGSEEAAVAIGKILESMPLVAKASPWARVYAARHQWTEKVAGLFAKLQKEHAESPVATLAARPHFPEFPKEHDEAQPPPEENPEEPAEVAEARKPLVDLAPPEMENEYFYGSGEDYVRDREFKHPDIAGFYSGDVATEADVDWAPEIKALLELRGKPAAQIAKTIATRWPGLRVKTIWDTPAVNCIHDLQDFAKNHADLPPNVFSAYVALRLKVINVCAFNGYALELPPVKGEITGGPEADAIVMAELDESLKDASLQAIHDRLAYLRILCLSNMTLKINLLPNGVEAENFDGEATIESREYAQAVKEAEAFIRTYPKSPRMEQVRLLHLRAVYRSRRPLYYSVPEADSGMPPTWATYSRVLHKNSLPWDDKIVDQAVAAFVKDFPKTRYADDIKELEMLLAARRREWGRALNLAESLLANENSQPHWEQAGMCITDIFSRLATQTERESVLAPVRKSAALKQRLEEYLNATDTTNVGTPPLAFLTQWLRERIAAK